MFLSEWSKFPSALCLLAGKKKTWWQLASRCCWNRACPWYTSEIVSFLVGLRTYQQLCASLVLQDRTVGGNVERGEGLCRTEIVPPTPASRPQGLFLGQVGKWSDVTEKWKNVERECLIDGWENLPEDGWEVVVDTMICIPLDGEPEWGCRKIEQEGRCRTHKKGRTEKDTCNCESTAVVVKGGEIS